MEDVPPDTAKIMKSKLFDVDLDDPVQTSVAFPRLLILCGEITVKAGDNLIFGHFGLDVAKWGLLATLDRSGGQLSMTHLKDKTYLMRSASNVTQMVDALEAKGYVRRVLSPTDRRVWLVELTENGHAIIGQVMQLYQEVMTGLLKEMKYEDLRQAITTILQWIWTCGEGAGLGHLKTTPSPFDDQ